MRPRNVGEIDPATLKIEVWPIDGLDPCGGQQAGRGHDGVRITHLPSGTTATVFCGRSQHSNQAVALGMIYEALTHPRHRP